MSQTPTLSQTAPPLRLTVAPNGARRMPTDHPNLPITLPDIVSCAQACFAAGAHDIHLHVRESDGRHSLSPDIYKRTIHAIEDAVPRMGIQVTTEAAGIYDVQAQFELLKTLRPKAASVAVRETLRAPDLVAPLYSFAAEAGIQVQHILYDHTDLKDLRRLQDTGEIPDHIRSVLLVFGKYNPPVLARPQEVGRFVQALGADYPDWTICAFGLHENAVASEAIKLGGHLRIGFENNIERPDGSLAADNAENITRTVQTAQSLDRPLINRIT